MSVLLSIAMTATVALALLLAGAVLLSVPAFRGFVQTQDVLPRAISSFSRKHRAPRCVFIRDAKRWFPRPAEDIVEIDDRPEGAHSISE